MSKNVHVRSRFQERTAGSGALLPFIKVTAARDGRFCVEVFMARTSGILLALLLSVAIPAAASAQEPDHGKKGAPAKAAPAARPAPAPHAAPAARPAPPQVRAAPPAPHPVVRAAPRPAPPAAPRTAARPEARPAAP